MRPTRSKPRLGGAVRQNFGGQVSEATITAWDPPHRFADEGTPGPDGVMHAMEITLEGRSGTTTVRFVHRGFLGDDWESEYEALAEGDPMYIHQLAEYVQFFRGRPVAIVEHFQPGITDGRAAMAILRSAMALGDATALGDAVRLEPAGLAPVEGSLDYLSATIIGLRTADALYRFAFIPMGGGIYMGHHVYRDDVDVAAVTSAWAASAGPGPSRPVRRRRPTDDSPAPGRSDRQAPEPRRRERLREMDDLDEVAARVVEDRHRDAAPSRSVPG